jgi:hypothetical protein
MSEARWTLGIGDPSIVGWFTVVAYFISAILAYRAGQRADERRIWWSIAVLLIALGINKQLDLQSWFTQVGRDMARAEGWYDQRWIAQEMFIAAIAVIGIGGAGFLFWWTRRRAIDVRIAVAGLALLFAFVFMRAASFHHIDRLIGSTVLGFRFNWIFELGGIAIIAVSAVRSRRRLRP